MNIDNLISSAKQKITGRVPRYIDINQAIWLVKTDIADAALLRCHSALEEAILGAQSVLQSTCQEYIEALYIADDFTIQIAESARHLEDGYPAREQKDDLLNSPKAKTSKDGNRYMVIPVGAKKGNHVQQAIEKKTSELFSKGRKSQASSRSLNDMVDEMRNLARSATNTSTQLPGKDGFKTVSDKQSPESWTHPGFQGVNQLDHINQRLRVDLEEQVLTIIEAAVDRQRR